MSTELDVTRGDTVPLFCDVVNFSGDLTLASSRVTFTVKRHKSDSDSDALIALTKASGRITAAGARLDWEIRPRDYDVMGSVVRDTKLYWDLQLTDVAVSPPTVYSLDSGVLVVMPEVRRGVA